MISYFNPIIPEGGHMPPIDFDWTAFVTSIIISACFLKKLWHFHDPVQTCPNFVGARSKKPYIILVESR